jgi:hypothetical protein
VIKAKDLIKLLGRVHPDTHVVVHLDDGEYAVHVSDPAKVGTYEDIEVLVLNGDTTDWVRVSEMTHEMELK